MERKLEYAIKRKLKERYSSTDVDIHVTYNSRFGVYTFLYDITKGTFKTLNSFMIHEEDLGNDFDDIIPIIMKHIHADFLDSVIEYFGLH